MGLAALSRRALGRHLPGARWPAGRRVKSQACRHAGPTCASGAQGTTSRRASLARWSPETREVPS